VDTYYKKEQKGQDAKDRCLTQKMNEAQLVP